MRVPKPSWRTHHLSGHVEEGDNLFLRCIGIAVTVRIESRDTGTMFVPFVRPVELREEVGRDAENETEDSRCQSVRGVEQLEAIRNES